MANPRKFSEKIALHNQKQAEETAAFEQIMREVTCATRSALNSLEDMKHGRDVPSAPHRGRHAVPHKSRTLDKKISDTSPYSSSAFLSPPPDTNWRRTNSDSALHHSAAQDSSFSANRRTPDGDSSQSSRTYWDSRDTKKALHQHLLLQLPTSRPRSCEVPPALNSFLPSLNQEDSGLMLANNTGSLPDLTTLHFPSPLAMPLDLEDYGGGGGGLAPGPLGGSSGSGAPRGSNRHSSPGPSPSPSSRRRHHHNVTTLVIGSPRHHHSQQGLTMDTNALSLDAQTFGVYPQQQQQQTFVYDSSLPPLTQVLGGGYRSSGGSEHSCSSAPTSPASHSLSNSPGPGPDMPPPIQTFRLQDGGGILSSGCGPDSYFFLPQTPTSIPDIIFTGADEPLRSDFVKDLGSASFDTDFFTPVEALRAGLDPIDLDGLQILTDPDIGAITDPATEEAFRLDRST